MAKVVDKEKAVNRKLLESLETANAVPAVLEYVQQGVNLTTLRKQLKNYEVIRLLAVSPASAVCARGGTDKPVTDKGRDHLWAAETATNAPQEDDDTQLWRCWRLRWQQSAAGPTKKR